MEYNELTYLETLGSLPVFYPVIRYFHSKTQTHKDYDGVQMLDESHLSDFLNTMLYRYKPDKNGNKEVGSLSKNKESDL